MKLSRRISVGILAALVALSSSVFLFGEKVYAQTVEPDEPDIIEIDVLRRNEPVIEESNKIVTEKANKLDNTTQEIQAIQEKKVALVQQVGSLKQELDEITNKIAEKKMRVEAERKRLEELKKMFVRVTRHSSDSAGNNYAAGNCTWYAKSRRPDASNSWGNANTWYYRAQAQGWNVGLTPKKGAIATSSGGWLGHVAYVEGVSLDGKHVTISEMNYHGLYSMNTRTVYYTEFQYIYELE